MESVKWIIFTVFLAFVGGAPTRKEIDRDDMVYVNDFNKHTLEMRNSSSEYFNSDFWRNSFKFKTAFPTSVAAHFSEKEFTVEQRIYISLEVYFDDMNIRFETNIFPFTFILGPFPYGEGVDPYTTDYSSTNVKYPFLNQSEIKLDLPADREFSDDKRNEIIKETIRLLKVAFNSKQRNHPAKLRVPMWVAIHRKQNSELDRLNSIRTISASSYTLDNLTISGLKNIEDILIYLPDTFRTVVGNVQGSVVQRFHAKGMPPVKFNFKVNTLYVSTDCFLEKVFVKAIGVSFVDTKLNKTLDEGQANLIMRDIEGAFESFLLASETFGLER